MSPEVTKPTSRLKKKAYLTPKFIKAKNLLVSSKLSTSNL